jgi:hypothetical protein
VLEQRTVSVNASTPAARESLGQLLHAVRAIRQARPSETRRILDGDAVGPALDLIAKAITRDELLALATTKPIPDAALRQLLSAELALERALGGQSVEKPSETSTTTPTTDWSRALRPGGLAPLPSLELLHLTPFDPRECVFRDGKWVVP